MTYLKPCRASENSDASKIKKDYEELISLKRDKTDTSSTNTHLRIC